MAITSFSSSPSGSLLPSDWRRWWMTNRMAAERYVKKASALLESQDPAEKLSALSLLDAATELSPLWDVPLRLKATTLLRLHRYRDITNLFRDDIPLSSRHDSTFFSSIFSDSLSRENTKLLSPANSAASTARLTRCLSVLDLKHRIFAKNSLRNGSDRHQNQQHWRYLILAQALFHLGQLDNALFLLQAGKRLASAASRRDSTLFSDDFFTMGSDAMMPEMESAAQLLANVKFLVRRRTAALAALDAGIAAEAIRHLSKILEGSRRPIPQAFLAECYMHRAAAYQATSRIPEAIADCNWTLALDPTCIEALSARASLFEHIRCFTECLQDLEHLKLLYDSILRDQKPPSPSWRQGSWRFAAGGIAVKARCVARKISAVKQLVVGGSALPVDYHSLLGLKRGCSRSELECTYRLLCLRHRPDRAPAFIDRCDFSDDRDADGVRDQAKMSALLLYRLLQKAYADVMDTILEEEAAEKQKQRASRAGTKSTNSTVPAAATTIEARKERSWGLINCSQLSTITTSTNEEFSEKKPVAVFPGGFCREIAGSGRLFSPCFTHPAHLLHETLSC